MDATQAISDSVLKSDESENEEEEEDDNRCRPVAKLCILRNEHIPETELHLFVGDNVLGRDPSSCTLPVPAPSISKKHVTISISVYSRRGRRSGVDLEALVWDLGSMNGTRKGRLKLTPNVRYALSDGDSLVLADIPCQFVSVNAVCLEKVTKTPVCKSFRIKESVPDSSGENVGDLNDCEELVNGDTKARTSTTKTAVQMNCLSVEQTPTQPEEILVPESDVDSDGEKDGDKVLVFDSDSHKSSPACSTFLSPANKTVPESEVESPMTPSSSSSSKNRLYRRVNFSEEKAEVNVARQPLKGKKTFAIVDDSEEEEQEEEKEEERTTPEVMETKKNDQNVPVTSEPAVSVLGQNKLSVSMTSVCTDVEEEEEGEGARSSGPESSNTNQVTKKLKIDDFHLDSDTDVDEDENSETTTTTAAAADETKPPAVDSGSPSKEVTVESDTDVEDHVDADADADADAPAPPADVKDLHMDSDTDVEEEDGDSVLNRSNSTLDETPSRLEVNPNQDDSAAAPHHGLHLESDTDDEEMPTPDLTEPPVVSAKELSTAASVGPDILSDSDTDVEDDSAEVGPPAATVSTAVVAGAAEPGTAVDGSNNRPVEESSKPPDLSVNSDGDTDVEEEEEEEEETEEGQMPELCRENTCQMLVPLPQNCSTPVQLSERKVEELETQPFLCPSVPFSGAGGPDDSSSSSEKEEEENVAEASTQAFILQSQNCQSNSAEKQAVDAATESPGDENDPHSSRGGSFQLGLSDSSHLQAQAPDQDTEETQAFIPVGTSVFWDQTQEYAADPHLEATWANEEAEDSPRCSVTSEKESQQSLELETTQAYESKSSSDPQHETDEQQEKHRIETAETQLIETRPVSDCEETDQPEGAPPQQRSVGEVFLMAETQPMKTSDDEDFFQVPQKIKSKRLQPVTGSGFSIAETQPMAASENDDSDDDAASPGNHLSNDCEEEESDESQSFLLPRKRKAKQLHLQEEESQTLRNSETSAGETQSVQPVQTELGQEGESPPESRAKAATREAETQIICSSEVFPAAAQPHVDSETKDEDDLMIGQRKRKTKALQPEDEETQPLSVDVQPKVKGEDTENEESVSGQRKTKAKVKQPEEEEEEVQQPLAVAEAVEQPERQRRKQSEAATRQVSARNKRGTRSKEDKDQVECLPKRQTRGRNKSLSETRRERSPAEEAQSQGSEGLRGRKECSGINGKQEGDEETDKRESDEKDEEQRETCGQNIREEEQIEIQKQLQTENSDKEEQAERLELDTHDQVQVERRTKVRDRMETLEAPLPEHEEEERKDQEEENQHQEKPEETGEAEKNNRTDERQENTEETDKNKVPARGRKTGRGRNDEQILVEQNSGPKSDDGPARRTRSRSNSSNSISSERSASSVGVQDNRGRGRGRGAKPKSQPPQTPGGRNVNCRRTRRDSRADDAPPQEVFSRSNSSNSLNSDISSSSVSSVRQRERTRRTEVPVGTQRSSISAPRAAAGGRRGRNTEGAANVTEEKVEPLQSRTTRGQRRATASSSEVAAPGEDNQSTQEESLVSEEPHQSKRKVRGQVEKSISDVRAVTSPHHSSVSDADETKDTRRGRKRELQATVEEGSCSGAKVVKVENQRPTTQEERKDEAVVHTRRRGRTSTAQPKKTAVEEKVKEEEVEKVVQRRGRGRSTAVYNSRKEEEEVEEEEEESGTPPPAVDQDGDMEQAVTRTVTRKRPSSVNSTPVAKTRRASSSSSSFSSSSPAAAGGRVRAASQDFRVLFTGLVDEAGEKVLVRLGGSMAKGIADMNILVTDKVRRTVKFLCAMAKGVPIVTTRWLEMSGRAGSFISTDTFLVKDPEQEKKFSFCLQESLRRSQGQPLLQGYEVHVTKSVKPEPVHMKDIISCSGGTFLPRMPCSHKPQTVVVSCEADWALCGPAVAASLPVVSVEFILTGILQQKVDLQSHALTVAQPRPAAGRGRARRNV